MNLVHWREQCPNYFFHFLKYSTQGLLPTVSNWTQMLCVGNGKWQGIERGIGNQSPLNVHLNYKWRVENNPVFIAGEINTLFLLGKNCFRLNKVIWLTSQSMWDIDVWVEVCEGSGTDRFYLRMNNCLWYRSREAVVRFQIYEGPLPCLSSG